MAGGGEIRTDVAIAGAGIIGLSLGLELRLRGRSVIVMERGQAMREASWAAGGMLAVEDPQNPPEMMELARLSWRLYPEWLKKIEELSGSPVPMRTRQALQWISPEGEADFASEEEIRELAPGLRMDGLRFRLIQEGSVDPRDLCVALPKAFAAVGGILLENAEVFHVEHSPGWVSIETKCGLVQAEHFVDCRGAWAGTFGNAGAKEVENSGIACGIPVYPVKGQMVELRCAPERLKCVVRAPAVYLIPRGDGRVAVGATLERAGFNTHVEENMIAGLINSTRKLLPEIESREPLRCWAGLRPGTPDGLPVIGLAAGADLGSGTNGIPRHWLATGHYRDGILLAPATARVMAQAIVGKRTDVPLEPFSAARFARAAAQA